MQRNLPWQSCVRCSRTPCKRDPVYYRPHPKDGQGNIFSQFTLAGGGGGYTISGLRWRGGGTLARSRGVPHLRSEVGGTPARSRWWGVPPWTWDGVPPRHGMGYSPGPGMRYTPQTWDWVLPPWTFDWVPHPPDLGLGSPPPPQTDQHSELLLRGGRYASCVHAGGLSCYINEHYESSYVAINTSMSVKVLLNPANKRCTL